MPTSTLETLSRTCSEFFMIVDDNVFSVKRRSRSDVSKSVSQSVILVDLTDVTLVSEDAILRLH